MEIACSLIHASLFFSAIHNPVMPAGTEGRYIYSVLGTACRRCGIQYHQTALHTDRLARSTGAWPAGNCVGLHARSACSGSHVKCAPLFTCASFTSLLCDVNIHVEKFLLLGPFRNIVKGQDTIESCCYGILIVVSRAVS